MNLFGARRATVLGLAVAMALAGCSSSSSSSSNSTGSSKGGGSSKGNINIAMTGPLTGDNGQYGQDQIQGMQLAVDAFNAAGGVPSGPNKGRKLALTSHDDAGDPNQGASVAQSLCDDTSVLAVLGPVNSSVALAAGPVYNRCGVTEVTSYASNPKITLAGFTNVFRSIPNDSQLGEADVAAAVQVAGKKKIAVVYSNDDYGSGLDAAVKSSVSKYGATIVSNESFTPGSTKDFSSVLTKIKSSNPDALLLMTTYSDAGLLANQARQVGITAQMVVPTGSNTPQFLKLGGKAIEGVLTPVLFNPDSTDTAVKKFITDFKTKFKRDPGESSATGYGSVQLVEYALTQGATSRKDVSAKLSAGKNMPTILGSITFDKNRDPSSLGSLVALTVKGGKFVASPKQFPAK